MKHKYTDEEIQTAIDGACEETHRAHNVLSGQLYINKHDKRYPDDAHARLHLLKSALDKLPEPQPPTADSKTPGQVAFEAAGYCNWELLMPHIHERHNKIASAVLAAFGGAGLEAAIARMEAVPWKELDDCWTNADSSGGASQAIANAINAVRARLIAAAREGQPATVDWKSRHDELQKAYAGHADVTAALHDKVQKAEAELALMTLDYDKCRKERGELLNQRDQLLARPQLSTLRPIAEAGEVPAGCVRLTGARNDDGTWELAEAPATSFDTHCADFYLPDPLAEAVKRMESVTWEELDKSYHPSRPSDEFYEDIKARLIQAAKGEQP